MFIINYSVKPNGRQLTFILSLLSISLFLGDTSTALADSNKKATSGSTEYITTNMSVEIVDLTPKFLKFYETAVNEKADPNRRWQLWQEHYNFAAVPPIPERREMARKILDKAWPEYAKAIDRIKKGATLLTPAPQEVLKSVAKLLNHTNHPIKVKLIVFVGGFENNAFAYNDKNGPVICIPIEINDSQIHRAMVHEFAHTVHSSIKMAVDVGRPSQEIQRLVAQDVLDEGLAMRVTQKLVPGLRTEDYLSETRPGWFRQCEENRALILNDIRKNLNDKDVYRFSVGTGTTGIERGSYYAGWLVAGRLEEHNMSLADIAKFPSSSIVDQMNKVIDSLLLKKMN